tara:strand:- start:5897 stop:6070 length:174 start_codon:yes stop_codon:yes gene_type:complete
MVSSKLSILHDMWIKNVIDPAHIISYLDKLDLKLSSLTLGGISAISKDKKTKYSYGK